MNDDMSAENPKVPDPMKDYVGNLPPRVPDAGGGAGGASGTSTPDMRLGIGGGGVDKEREGLCDQMPSWREVRVRFEAAWRQYDAVEATGTEEQKRQAKDELNNAYAERQKVIEFAQEYWKEELDNIMFITRDRLRDYADDTNDLCATVTKAEDVGKLDRRDIDTVRQEIKDEGRSREELAKKNGLEKKLHGFFVDVAQLVSDQIAQKMGMVIVGSVEGSDHKDIVDRVWWNVARVPDFIQYRFMDIKEFADAELDRAVDAEKRRREKADSLRGTTAGGGGEVESLLREHQRLLQQQLIEQQRWRMGEEERFERQMEVYKTPEQHRAGIRRLEEKGKAPLMENIDSERATMGMTESEREWWRLRYLLAVALNKRVTTFSFEKMYPEHPINELRMSELEFLWGSSAYQGRPVGWEARQPSEMEIALGELQPGIQGFLEADSLYATFVADNVCLVGEGGFFGREEALGVVEMQEGKKEPLLHTEMREFWSELPNGEILAMDYNMPYSIFKNSRAEHLDALVNNVAVWLMVTGRVRPINNSEAAKAEAAQHAVDVARAAWNLFAQGNEVEVHDCSHNQTKLKRCDEQGRWFDGQRWVDEDENETVGGGKRIVAGVDARLMNLAVRNACHPQDRLIAKGADLTQSVWSKALDGYAANLTKRREKWVRHLIPRPWRKWNWFGVAPEAKNIDVLPKDMLWGAFEDLTYEYKYRDARGREKEVERNVWAMLVDNGRALLADPGAELERPNFGSVGTKHKFEGMKEGPFGGYIFGVVERAGTVQRAIVEGVKGQDAWLALGKAYNELNKAGVRITGRHKEHILMNAYVAQANTGFHDSIRLRVKIKPGRDRLDWYGYAEEANRKMLKMGRQSWLGRQRRRMTDILTRWVDYV